MAFSSDEKKPGEKVGLILKAEPGSLFAIAAVDKSILLMASNNDVNKEQVRCAYVDPKVQKTL